MPNAAKTVIREIDLTSSTNQIPKGIMGVEGATKRGPVNSPNVIINSYGQFLKLYGGLMASSTFPLEMKRAMERGTKLRVNSLRHYTNINDSSTIDAVKATAKSGISLTIGLATVSGDTINLSIVTSGGTRTASQAFVASHNNTMILLANKILAASTDFASARVVKNTTAGGNNLTLVISTIEGVTITSGTIQLNATTAINGVLIASIKNSSGTTLFTLTPKGPGQDYNKTIVSVQSPSNNQAGFFDIFIIHLAEPDVNESYKNLYLVSSNALSDQVGLATLSNSYLYDILSIGTIAAVTDLDPLKIDLAYDSGTNGSTLTATDYIGSQTAAQKLGFFAFDQYDDILTVSAPALDTTSTWLTVHQAGTAYAEGRKDLVYFIHSSNSATTAVNLITQRDATLIDSSYVGFYGGGLNVLDPNTAQPITVPELGDILGLVSYTHSNFGEWYSFAGPNRGIIFNSSGPVTNFGTVGAFADLDLLANSQINMVILQDNKLMLWGNFTAQRKFSVLSFMSIRFLVIFMKKVLKPYLNNFLEEPNDPTTWRQIYYGARPFLKSLSDNRALFGPEGKGWRWMGDQEANTLDDLVINNSTDVLLGKYKIKLFIKPVNSLQEIELSITLTPGGISFDEAVALV